MSSTEVQDWMTCRLREFAKVTTGTKDVNEGNPRGKYPFFTCARALSFSDVYSFDEEAILVAGNGAGVGNLHFYDGKFEVYQRTYVVREISCSPRYLWHVMDYGLGKSIGLETIGTSIPYIKMKNITEFEFKIPKRYEEQTKIAAILDDTDALLMSLEALIAKKKNIKQGAMQQLLTGKTRLPGFSGEWKEVRLGDFATMSSGGTPPSKVKEYYGGNIKWVSIADMTKSGKRLIETEEHLTDLGLVNSSAAIYKTPIILYAMYASLGEVCICHEEVSSSQAILGIVPGNNLEIEFLYYLLLAYKPIVKTLGQQGTQSNLNKKMVQDFIFSLPPDQKEQTAIAEVLSDMDAEIDALVARRDKTALIKTGMMQELLTGRTRLL